MGKYFAIIMAVGFVWGCASTGSRLSEGKDVKTLIIRWQRLLDEKDQTCERCGSTEQELQKAFQSLKKSLAPLGIEVTLIKKALDPATCAKDVTQSNRIWVGERPLEEWVGAQVGKNPCGLVCADLGEAVECRTVTVGGKTYETIPSGLIIKAGLLAGSQLIEMPSKESCCLPPDPTQITVPSCCPKPMKPQVK